MHHDNGIWVSSDDLNREENFLKSAEKEFTVETAVETDGQWEASRRDFLKIMGFGIGVATLSACETPVKKAIPYVSKPDEIVPGVANYFASSIVDGGDYCSVLVKTREGTWTAAIWYRPGRPSTGSVKLPFVSVTVNQE